MHKFDHLSRGAYESYIMLGGSKSLNEFELLNIFIRVNYENIKDSANKDIKRKTKV